MPAPKNNENAVKHGQRCRFGLMIGGGPKATRYVTAKLCVFREALEQACIATHGEVDLVRAASISTALRWERVAALSTKWFREQGDSMTTLDRVALQKSIAEASERRDRAIEKLKIAARSPEDVLTEAYRTPLASSHGDGEPNTAEQAESASDAAVGDDSGNEGSR